MVESLTLSDTGEVEALAWLSMRSSELILENSSSFSMLGFSCLLNNYNSIIHRTRIKVNTFVIILSYNLNKMGVTLSRTGVNVLE